MSESAPPPAASLWEDFIDVFISPAELFRRRRDGRFGHAILALVLVTAVIFFTTREAMEPIFEAEFQRGMAAQPGFTPEQVEAARTWGRNLAPVMVLVGLPIACLLLGLVVWAVARFFGTGMGYQRGAAIASFAMFPRLIEGVTNAAQALLMDQGKLTSLHSLKLGASRFLDPSQSNGIVLALLGRIDLFTLWVTALIAVGIREMTSLGTARAALAAALVWVVGAIPALMQGLSAR